MLKEVFKKLDKWVTGQNEEVHQEGGLHISPFEIRVLGQTALMEAKIDLDLPATQDVDAYTNGVYAVKQKLNELLKPYGKHMDELSHEIWMPEETEYSKFFDGVTFKAFLAKPEYILISKVIKAPHKNKNLIIEYLAKKPSNLFLSLAKKYNCQLEEFLK